MGPKRIALKILGFDREPLRKKQPAAPAAENPFLRGSTPSSEPAVESMPAGDYSTRKAPRQPGSVVTRWAVRAAVLLVALAGLNAVIIKPIRDAVSRHNATGPAQVVQVDAGAATQIAGEFAMDYLSYSPATAAAGQTALSSEFAGTADPTTQQWTGADYVRADAVVPGQVKLIGSTQALVSLRVRITVATAPAKSAVTSSQPQVSASAAVTPAPATTAPAPAPSPPPSAVPRPTTTSARTSPAKPSESAPTKTQAPSAPKPTASTGAKASTAAASSSGSVARAAWIRPLPANQALVVALSASSTGANGQVAADPGPVPAGWTAAPSQWVALTVPVVTSTNGQLAIGQQGPIFSAEPLVLMPGMTGTNPDSPGTDATRSVVKTFLAAFGGGSDLSYLVAPGVTMAGLHGAVSLVDLPSWALRTAAAGSTQQTGSAGVTWQLSGTSLTITQHYVLGLTENAGRYYTASVGAVLNDGQ